MAYGKEMLDKIKSNKEMDVNKRILEHTEGSLVGAGIGLILGLTIGYSRKYNLVASGLVGVLLGGFISRQLIIFKNK